MTCTTTCNKCCNLIKTTKLELTGTAPNQMLTITIPNTIKFVELKEYCLVICQPIPPACSNVRVLLAGHIIATDVRNRKGNYLRADQIRTRTKYRLIYGADPGHYSILSPVCKGLSGVAGSSATPPTPPPIG